MTKNEQELTLLMEYFKLLREEIHIRIKEHTRLVWIKIVSLGAIISFLMERFYLTGMGRENPNSGLYFVWIIPLVAVIFDFLIAGNLRVIYNLGAYIKEYMEKKSFKEYVHIQGFKFWEEGIAQALEQRKYHCYTPLDMIIIWSFTLASWSFSMVLRGSVGFTYYADIPLAVFSAGLIGIALLYLVRSITMERKI